MNVKHDLDIEKSYHRKRRLQKAMRKRKIRKNLCLTFFTFCLVITLSLFYQSFSSKAKSISEPIQYKYYKSVSVSYGETLTTMALAHYENGYESVEDYISEVKNINHLDSDSILAGQFLILPYYSSELK